MENVTRPLRVASAKHVVADAIRDLIADGTLVPGERVSIESLAEHFGVSRTPVRDALNELSGEGLVKIEPRVGVTIRKIERQEIIDVYRIEEALSPVVAACAAERGTEAQRRELRGVWAQMEHASSSDDVEAYLRLVMTFRSLLLDMAGSDPFRAMFAALDGRVQRWRYHNLSQPGRMAKSAEDYRDICEAIAVGDAERASALMGRHMENAEARARQTMDLSESVETSH
jgi:GntR family transcriptional regulator, rspAB operon transcriptional repressor